MRLALGLIETKGLIGSIEAADAMVKAAKVKLISKEIVTGALVLIKVEGEVGAVKSAVDAGAAAAQRVGQLVSTHIIPRPDDQIDEIIYQSGKNKTTQEVKVQKKSSKIKVDEGKGFFDAQEEDDNALAKEEKAEVKSPPPAKDNTAAVKGSPPETNKAVEEKLAEKEIKQENKKAPEIKKEEKPAKAEVKKAEDKIDDNPITGHAYIPSEAYLSNLNVHELRKLARGFEDFPIKGRDISKANRKVLLNYFKQIK